MAKQVLIYERAVPVSAQRHGKWSVKTGVDYSFAREVNSLPLLAIEFPNAASEYAIVFAGTAEAVLPAVILGLRDSENLYLGADGTWQGRYVPAFVRRYPFVFSGSEDGKTFTLCVDESFSGCNQEGRGEKLFDSEGQRTQYLETMLAFLKEYQVRFIRTQAFCRKLKELDLLEPMRAQITLKTGQRMGLEGFMAVSRERLKKLTGDQLASLAKTDELELLYLHMQSMRNFQAMLERVAPGQTTSPADTAPERSDLPAAGEGEGKKAETKGPTTEKTAGKGKSGKSGPEPAPAGRRSSAVH